MTDDHVDGTDGIDASAGEPADLTPEVEAAIRGMLAALPDPELPEDVERRILAAVATTAGPAAATREPAPETLSSDGGGAERPRHALVPTRPPSRGWRSPWLLQSAAVLVIVALVGAVFVGWSVNRDGGGGQVAGSGQPLVLSQATPGPITTSGRTYSSATLPGQIRGLIVGTAAAAAAPAVPTPAPTDDAEASGDSGVSGYSTTTQSLSAGVGVPSAAAAAVSALVTDPKRRQACIDQLASSPGAQPVAVDAGVFDGKPAAVFVLPDETDPTKVAAWVVGPTCSPADNPFPYRYERVARP